MDRTIVAEEYKVGVFAVIAVAAVAGVIAWLDGPIWYSVGPALVYLAYLLKVKIRGIRDRPLQVMLVLAVVSLAMIGFAVF